MEKKIKKISILIITATVLFCTLFSSHIFPPASVEVHASEKTAGSSHILARPSTNGQLTVRGTKLRDPDANIVELHGLSLHGLTWYPDFVDENIFSQVSNDFGCNLIRLPVYSEVYSSGDSPKCLELVRKGIDLAIENDMYVLVDWHILEDGDPNTHIQEAAGFFSIISEEYAGVPNILYEICNEPNGETTWSQIAEFANDIIPIIRENSPEAVIMVGTPNFSRDLLAVSRNILGFQNVMYSLHFYSGTHGEDLRGEMVDAINRMVPVFVTECGISESSGTGETDYESAAQWFQLLDEYDVSYTVWNLSNKDESSSLLQPTYVPGKPITYDDLTPVGSFVIPLIQGQDPNTIPIKPEDNGHFMLPKKILRSLTLQDRQIANAWPVMAISVLLTEVLFLVALYMVRGHRRKKHKTYDDYFRENTAKDDFKESALSLLKSAVLLLSIFCTLMYLVWRVRYSIPFSYGILAVAANIILLIVEVFGFVESIVLYMNLIQSKEHPLPIINNNEYPEVDIFIATYNEPEDLLSMTINACNHLQYPDRSKVHVWLCDDNRRPQMRALAERMGIGYFDRPDNKGAKAGNLNNALRQTTAPYVVTLDADMIVRSEFLLKTIPYFVDAKKRNIKLGLIQTPQSFYEPDIFQFALYSETTAPNEQDFFYRTIEPAKTSSNSVIYGGSNTIIARAALDAIGGFFEGSITEDFATGLLIESSGFVSLGLPEPLANGKTPDTFKEHIQQRVRWGRGVISSSRQLKIFTRPGLTLSQRFSYWSSIVYWYSPIKNLIYMLSPLVFAVFGIPVFICSWVNLLMFWFPMYIMQDLCLRAYSKNSVSLKWSGIYETSVMPYLLKPTIKEFFGITTKKFAVTDKSKKNIRRDADKKAMIPFFILIGLSVLGIIISLFRIHGIQSLGVFILLFWLFRNLYFLIMSLFLADGRDGDGEDVHVVDAEPLTVNKIGAEGMIGEGITTYLTAHSLKFYLDEPGAIKIGDRVLIRIFSDKGEATVNGVITGITKSRSGKLSVYSAEILDFEDSKNEYLQILFDRIPSLPQSLGRDFGTLQHLIRNIAHRVLR